MLVVFDGDGVAKRIRNNLFQLFIKLWNSILIKKPVPPPYHLKFLPIRTLLRRLSDKTDWGPQQGVMRLGKNKSCVPWRWSQRRGTKFTLGSLNQISFRNLPPTCRPWFSEKLGIAGYVSNRPTAFKTTIAASISLLLPGGQRKQTLITNLVTSQIFI